MVGSGSGLDALIAAGMVTVWSLLVVRYLLVEAGVSLNTELVTSRRSRVHRSSWVVLLSVNAVEIC